ncbi:MAG: HAD family hydrolase [Oscillospiraceae bacterium]|nr:HAD family hydrolase [Oscillospiraceae bacterium]
MTLNNIFLITDADGTLLTDDKRILDTDRAAIAEILNAGGMFTIATGRGVSLARTVINELGELPTKSASDRRLCGPAVIFNGAAVYDYNTEEFLWRCCLSDNSKNYIRQIIERFPSLGVEILREQDVYVINSNRLEEDHLSLGNIKPVCCSFDEVPDDDWIKVLFVDEPEVIDKVIEFSKKQDFSEVHMVRSAPVFYEVLPHGINKGTGFKKLLELMNITDRYIIAAGDFMNDLEMLQMADLGVAVANAEDIVKQSAQLIVCDNNSGVVNEIVNYLRRGDLRSPE